MMSSNVPIVDGRPDDWPWPAMTWPPSGDTELLGKTVVLNPAVPERDAEDLFAALDVDAAWHHVAGRPDDVADMGLMLRRWLEWGLWPWVIRLVRPVAHLPAGSVVGMSSYLDVSVTDARAEIGCTAYSPLVWGTAVNPETKLLLLGYAFDELGAGRVQLKTDVRNVRSQRAIAGLGARYEGTLRRYQRRADGTVRDTVMFSVSVEEWPDVRDHILARLSS